MDQRQGRLQELTVNNSAAVRLEWTHEEQEVMADEHDGNCAEYEVQEVKGNVTLTETTAETEMGAAANNN